MPLVSTIPLTAEPEMFHLGPILHLFPCGCWWGPSLWTKSRLTGHFFFFLSPEPWNLFLQGERILSNPPEKWTERLWKQKPSSNWQTQKTLNREEVGEQGHNPRWEARPGPRGLGHSTPGLQSTLAWVWLLRQLNNRNCWKRAPEREWRSSLSFINYWVC